MRAMLSVTITFALALAGCTATSQSVPSAAARGTSLAAEFADASRISRTLQIELAVTTESLAYARGELSARVGPVCSTDVADQFDLSKERVVKINLITGYLTSLNTYYTKTPEALDQARAASTAIFLAASMLGIEGAVVSAGTKKLTGTVFDLIQVAAQNARGAEIALKASRLDKSFGLLVDDVATGLRSLEEASNARIKTWEQCEYEKLIYLRGSGDATVIDYERRYGEFVRARYAISGSTQDPNEVSDLAKQLKAAHRALFEVKDLAAAKTAAQAAYEAGKQLYEAIQKVDKARKDAFPA